MTWPSSFSKIPAAPCFYQVLPPEKNQRRWPCNARRTPRRTLQSPKALTPIGSKSGRQRSRAVESRYGLFPPARVRRHSRGRGTNPLRGTGNRELERVSALELFCPGQV